MVEYNAIEWVPGKGVGMLGSYGHFFEDADALKLLHSKVKAAGGQNAFSRQTGVERSHLNLVLNGRRPLSPSIIDALNLRVVYVPDVRGPSVQLRRRGRSKQQEPLTEPSLRLGPATFGHPRPPNSVSRDDCGIRQRSRPRRIASNIAKLPTYCATNNKKAAQVRRPKVMSSDQGRSLFGA
jgi:hypothetical protein